MENRPAYSLLKKIVRKRTYLLNNNIGKKNLQLINKLEKIKIWVEAWPNAPEHGCVNFMRQNYADLIMLMPSCNASKKLIIDLNTFINEQN